MATTSIDDDKALAQACAAGKREAQREFYERYRTPLYRMALRYARDEAEAEDFVHDGVVQALQRVDRYKGTGPLGAWVRRVALNQILMHLRQRPKISSLETSVTEPATEMNEEELQEMPPATLHRLIRELPLGYRTVFSLYYLEEYDHARIASKLGISVGSSKSQLSKARRALRAAIRTQFPQLERFRK